MVNDCLNCSHYGSHMTPEFDTAEDIAEYFLDRTGTALMTGDFDLFASCFLLPQKMETFQGRRDIETLSDLREVFDGVTLHFKRKNATQLERHCIEARFRDPDTVVSTHMSRLVSGSSLVQKPYPVMSVLKRVDGIWQISDSMYAIEDEESHARALSG